MVEKNYNLEEQLGEAPPVEYLLYGGKILLKYEDAAHIYYMDTPEGRIIVPNTTSVTGLIDKSNQLIPWAVKLCVESIRAQTINANNETWIPPNHIVWEEILTKAKSAHREVKKTATDIGHLAHKWLEEYGKKRLEGFSHYDAEKLTPMPDNDAAKLCVLAALDWIVTHHVEPIEVERKVYSIDMNVAGTLDWIGFVDGKRSILDFKSSKALYDEYLYQIACYRAAYEEETGLKVEQCILLKLGKEDGSFETRAVSDDNEYLADLMAFKGLLIAYERIKEREEETRQRKAAEREAKAAVKATEKAAAAKEKADAKAAKKAAKEAEKVAA